MAKPLWIFLLLHEIRHDGRQHCVEDSRGSIGEVPLHGSDVNRAIWASQGGAFGEGNFRATRNLRWEGRGRQKMQEYESEGSEEMHG